MFTVLRRSICLILLSLGCAFSLSAQLEKKSFEAKRTSSRIKIDGVIDESEWANAPMVTDFVQRRPTPGEASRRKTEVFFLYDDDAVYIAAKLYEEKKDIFNLLTNRDNIGNSDYFGVSFDPYQAGLNGVGLFVTVAGVQNDVRYSNGGNERIWRNDRNWNAVWNSATKIYDDHWVVEYKIPYAVLRFNSKNVQDWGINFVRINNSLNETSFWNPIDPEINGFLNQAGIVKGIRDVKPPTRLFFYPYVSTVVSRSTNDGVGTPQLNGGMDIKYGINDAFTLDMTLIPDFSGVRSDNQVLNLSPFEVRFDENRQFFTEGVELFNKAGLFYSRRIGETSVSVSNLLGDNESIVSRPAAAQLINASKITGRTNSGLGIGFFNAVTDKTVVTVEDSETGELRDIEADPLTNFNVLVLDQNLKNNSSITLTNTNVLRANNDAIEQGGNTEIRTGGDETYTRGRNVDDANVTAVNFTLNNPTLTWRVRGSFGYSQLFAYEESLINDEQVYNRENLTGFRYNLSIDKVRGNWRYGASRRVESDTYNFNALGFQRRPNRIEHQANLSYNQFKPRGVFNNWSVRLNGNYNELYEPKSFGSWRTNLNFNAQLRNFWGFSAEVGGSPQSSYDFFESRVSGYVFKRPASYTTNFSLRTDSRKMLRLSGRVRLWSRPEWDQNDSFINVSARVRIGERAEVSHNLDLQTRLNERGYATRLYDDNGDLDQVILGQRDVRNVTNTVNGRYIFTNRMGVTLRVRHYWSRVVYKDFYQLTENDQLANTDYTGIDSDTGIKRHDRNFNTFNVDMEYNWQFGPGSEIRAIWKRSIGTDNKDTDLGFFNNFGDTFSSPNFDTITIRLVYFIDYLNVKKIFTRS